MYPTRGSSNVPDDAPRPTACELEPILTAERYPEDLAEEEVWGIVCRWQGMRCLFDLYCDAAIYPVYLNSVFPWWHQRSHEQGKTHLGRRATSLAIRLSDRGTPDVDIKAEAGSISTVL